MSSGHCEAGSADADPKVVGESVRDRAKRLILKTLGVKRVAGYVGVADDTVYQALARGTDEHPVPARWAPKIVSGAQADGLDAPLELLWPAMAGVRP